MTRVASLYLPDWPIDRLRRAERRHAPPPERAATSLEPLGTAAETERANECSAPRGGGWRPGARWARGDLAREVAALPAHQRPPMREMGRHSEAAGHPFKPMRPDDGGPSQPGLPVSQAASPEPSRVIVHKTGARVTIAALSASARIAGLRQGMALTQARALLPALLVDDADAAGDLADLETMAIAFARRWSPVVALSGEDGLFLDVTGTAHLHGGEEAMARRIVRLLARLGITAHIAIADTAGAAWALARHRPDRLTILVPGRQQRTLAPLPAAALRLDASATDLLDRLGIATIGQLANVPRAPLARRFGRVVADRLDQAMGTAPEPLDPVIPPERIMIEQRFAEPIATAEAIAHWLGILVPRLVTALAKAGLGARSLILAAERVDGDTQAIRVGLARATRDAAHLHRLLARRIEEIAPGHGIDALSLHVRRTDPLGPESLATDLAQETAPDLAPLVDQLANRLGARRLWRCRAIESEVPERSVLRCPPLSPPERGPAQLRVDDVRRLALPEPDHPWHPRWPRPARLLRRPERLDHVLAELPDSPPRRFTWRGRAYRVTRGDGPERIHGEWWRRVDERDAVRDYFRVEDESGARFWLFRRGDAERSVTGDLSWYIHGAFG